MQNQIDLNPEQIVTAATAGVQLFSTPGAVNVPGPMAITGVIGVLNSLLVAIANRQVIVVNRPAPAVEGKTPPEGDGEKKPDLKPVDSGKAAEK